MVPVIVKTSPVNGQRDVPLNEFIRIYFDGALASIDIEDVMVENLNSGELIEARFEQYDDLVTIYVQDRNAHADNFLCGLSTYQVTLRNIAKASSPSQQAQYVLKFTTEAETLQDINNTESDNDSFNTIDFVVTKTFPVDQQKNFTPKYIKIEFSNIITSSSVREQDPQTVFLIKGSPEQAQEKLMFREYESLITADDDFTNIESVPVKIGINKNVLMIFPLKEEEDQATLATLEDNLQYTVIINNICGGGSYQHKIDQIVLTFWTAYSPLYVDANDIISTPYYGIVTQERSANQEFIYRLIQANSLLAESIARDAGKIDSLSWAADTLTPCIVEFVKYKTLYDLLFDKYITVVSSSEDKTLSDLTISYANKPTYLKSLLEDLDRRRAAAEDKIRKFEEDIAPMTVCIKGSAVDEEYDFMNRAMRDLEGNKSW